MKNIYGTEKCNLCRNLFGKETIATHKVEEEVVNNNEPLSDQWFLHQRHASSNYVCDSCFSLIMSVVLPKKD